MLFEKIIFTILATYLLLVTFFKLMKKIDKIYIPILAMQALGLILEFIEIIFIINLPIFIKIIMYIVSVIIPITLILMERKGKNFSEIFYQILAKFYELAGNTKKSKELWLLLIDKFPDNHLAHIKLAEIYEKEGGMRKAIDEYVKAVDLDKKDYDSYYKISYLLNELGKKEDAKVMLNNLLSKKPDYIEGRILLRRYSM